MSMVAVDVAVSWLHLMAAVIWIGGMLYALLVVMPSLAVIDPPPIRGRFMGAILARFGPFVWIAIALLLLTGIVRAFSRISSLASLVTTTFGLILVVKVALFLAMIAIAAYLGFVLTPRMAAMSAAQPPSGAVPPGGGAPAGPPPGVARLQGQAVMLGQTNLVLGILVVTAAVVLRWV